MVMNSSAETRHFNLTLIAIALLCLVPMLMLGTSQFVEYDGYWHVWISQQDRWFNFIREYQADAHPPLYYLLLRACLWLGRTPLIYRAISLLAGTASVWMLGRTALKALHSPVWAGLAALAYGLSLPVILTSNEVRGYMLSSFFMEVSFYYFLDLVGSTQPPSLRPRVIFGVMTVLACLTEYYALLYLGAVMLFALALPVVRRGEGWPRALLREIATFAAILVIPVAEYISHLGARSVAYDHLPDYYFQAGGAESAIQFLLRNLRNELNWFSPWKLPDGSVFYAVLAALVAVAIAIAFLVRRGNARKNSQAVASLVIPLLIVGAIMSAALIRAYPFGGFLRQQFVLFPFLAVCPFLLADRVFASVPRAVSLTIAGVLALGVTYVNVEDYQAWPKISEMLLTDKMTRYNRLFPRAESIYIDQFNLITFFMHHHNWQWNFVAPLPGSDTIEVYKLSRDNRSMMVFRDKDHWNLDLRDPQLFSQMARGMRTWHLSSSTIFCLAQPVGKTRTEAQVTGYRNRVAELSAAAGLCVQRLDIDNYDVYAEFRTAGSCTTGQEPE